MKKVISVIASLHPLLFATILHAQCLMYPVSLQQRVQQSEIVVEGKVISSSSFWNTDHSMIYTATEIEVYKIFKGTLTQGKVSVISEGGQVDNEMVVAEPGVHLNADEAGIFFLFRSNISNARNHTTDYELFSVNQGFVKYDLVEKTANDPFNSYDNIPTKLYAPILNYAGQSNFIALKPADFFKPKHKGEPFAIPVISSFSPTSTYAGTLGANILTISGSNFGSSYVAGTCKLEFKNANDGGASYITTPDNHIQSWSSSSITTYVPTGAGSGTIRVTNTTGETGTSSASITINYNESNVVYSGSYYQPDLVSDNGSGGYTLVYNTTFNSNTAAVAAFERALSTWRCGTLENITKSGTTSIAVNASDGSNVVTFDGSSPLGTGILGTSYSYYSSCATGVWYLSENDLKFKTDGTDGVTWNFGPGATTAGQYDFESVCVHELGHTHQLGHTNVSPPSVMHYAISSGTDRRTLTTASEIDGGDDIMTRSEVNNSCGPTKMIALTAGTCSLGAAPVADFTGSVTSLCKNKTVNYTDASTNSPTSWSWTFSGGTPSTSTSQNPTGIKYKTAGTYSVTLVATNSVGSDTITKTSYITVNPLPTVTLSAAPCSSGAVKITATAVPSTGVKYKWLKDGVTITGAKSSTYNATVSGTYKCTVTISATNCKTTSSGLAVTISCKQSEEHSIADVNVYPNPSASSFTFSTSVFYGNGEVRIYDITGELIENSLFSGDDVVMGENLSSGVYLAKIMINGELKQVVKLVKD